MTVEQFRKTMSRRPFVPLVIHTADGGEFAVRHPETVALSPGGRVVAVFAEDDACDLIDLLLVTRLHESPARS